MALPVDLLLSIKRQVIAILRDDDLGEKSGGRQTSLDQAFGQSGNERCLLLILPVSFDIFSVE